MKSSESDWKVSGQKSMRSFLTNSTTPYSDKVFESHLLKWFVEDDQSFKVLDCPAFVKTILLLKPTAKLFGSDAAFKRIEELYQTAKPRVKALLRLVCFLPLMMHVR